MPRVKRIEPSEQQQLEVPVQKQEQEEQKEEVATENTPKTVEFELELDDEACTVSFKLTEGTEVVLREPTAWDWAKLEAAITKEFDIRNGETPGNSGIAILFTPILCQKWGEESKVSLDKVKTLRNLNDVRRLEAAINSFPNRD